MSRTNYCADGGYLVNAKGPVPTDKTEFSTPKTPYIQGCNSIYCRSCGKEVRSEPHFFPMGTSEQAEKIYNTADWRTLPELDYMPKMWENVRTYCCQCTVTFTSDARRLGDADDPRVPWSWECEGHPAPTLPYRIGDLTVALDTDFPALIERAFNGWQPAGLEPDPKGRPGMWIQDLYERLIGTEAELPLVHAVAAQLKSPDLKLVSQALRFFLVFGDADKEGILLTMAKSSTERERLRGVPDPLAGNMNYSTLEDKLVYALGKQADEKSASKELVQILRDYALIQKRVTPVLPALVKEDYRWTHEHVVELAGINPEIIEHFIVTAHSAISLDAGRAIGRLPQLDAVLLRRLARKYLRNGQDTAILAGIAERTGEAPPKKKAPAKPASEKPKTRQPGTRKPRA